MTREDRAVGALLGPACGDALGRPLDGLSGAEVARTYGRVTEMRSGGTRGEPAGTTTGETALAVGVGRSLRACSGFDEADLRARLRALDDAERCSEDPALAALGRLDGEGDGEPAGASAGVLVRAVPLALAHRDRERLADVVAAATRVTHAAPETVESCVAFASVLGGLLDGDGAAAALDGALSLAARRDAPGEVRTALAVALDGTTASVDGRGAAGTLEAALHDALTADGPEAAVVAAVNRGGRAATRGAATGAAAGARFGADALPDRWLDHLEARADLRDLAVALDGAALG